MTGLFITIIAVFLWAGFICAISFMESWLKFRAPGLTMPVGLSVGKLVFSALNKVEWFFAIVIVDGIFLNRSVLASSDQVWLLVIVVILIVQTAGCFLLLTPGQWRSSMVKRCRSQAFIGISLSLSL